LVEGKFGSPGNARNHGLSISKSKWVIFVDSDDVVNMNAVLSMIDRHDEKSNVLVGKYEICDRVTGALFKSECNSDPKMGIAINPGLWRMIFLRESISKLRFSTSLMGEDQLFLLDFGIFGQRAQFFDNVVYRYFRNSSGQLTGNKDAITHLKLVIPKTLNHVKFVEKSQRRYVSMMLLRQFLTQCKNLEKENYFYLLVRIISELKILSPNHYLYLSRSAFQLTLHKSANAH